MAKRSPTELFGHYYTILVYVLPMKDATFMDELSKHDLLPEDIKIKLESLTERNQRASCFLDSVIKPGLATGNSGCFISLLAIMKSCKHDNVEELSIEIDKELATDIKYPLKPLLKDLHTIIIPEIAKDWYELAIQLFDNSQLSRLDEISTAHSNNRREGCIEMLKHWLKITPEATCTWGNLIHVLKEPLGWLSIAENVEKKVKDKCSQAVTRQHLDNLKKPQSHIILDKCSQAVTMQHLDSLKKPQSQSTLDHPDAHTRIFEDDDVNAAFAHLFYELSILFDEVDFTQLKRACIQRGTLLSNDFKQEIKEANEIDALLDALDNPVYCNWLNTRLLKRIVKTIHIPEAERLILAYEKCVYSRKVSDVMRHFDLRCFKESHVSLIRAKISARFESLTVADIIEYCQTLECNIMGVCAGTVTAAQCQPGCLQITCVIPIHCALHAYETAKHNFLNFRQFHIQYIEIESFPKVFALKFAKENNLDELSSASDSNQAISHYYTCLENYMDADSVSHMMLCEHLITDDDYEAITAAPNDSKMNILLLQYVRSMNVSQLSRFCDILESIETHKIIGSCSSTSFQVSLQKLSTNVRLHTSNQSIVLSIESMKVSEVNLIFNDLVDHLYLNLSATEKLSFNLISKCSDIKSPFMEKWYDELSDCKSLFLFKIYLLPLITWFDHCILKDLVVVSGSNSAQQLLDQFDSKIRSYCNEPITSFPLPYPSQLMLPLIDSEYTILSIKYHPPSRGGSTQGMIILQDIMDIKLTLKRKWEIRSHDIQLVAVHAKLKLLYWTIPKFLVEMIESDLVNDWRSGIVMMAVLPANFQSLEDKDYEKLKGPFSSLNYLWEVDTEVVSSISLHNKLENTDARNLAQQYVQLHGKIKKEKKMEISQLDSELSEVSSKLMMREMELAKLKENNKRLIKQLHDKKPGEVVSQKPTVFEDAPEIIDKNQSQSKYSSELHIHQLMNIVPLIQEKWPLIGTRLRLLSDNLDDIWQAAIDEQIPAESRNTFCCVNMLTTWYKTSDNVSVDAIITAIDAPHVGLKTKISTIEASLTSEYVPTSNRDEETVTNPPEKLEQPYFDMITKFCLELSKSQHSISDILAYLKVCNINSDIYTEITDLPELVKSFERHELLNKMDLSWLKNIAHHVQCTKASEVIKEYENLLLADKIPWYSSHTKGSYLVGKTDKKPHNVTIKDSSNAKSAASRIVNIKESDSVLNSSEVGSVVFYWKILDSGIRIEIPKVVKASLIKECKDVDLTHVGIMIDGSLSLANIDEIVKAALLAVNNAINGPVAELLLALQSEVLDLKDVMPNIAKYYCNCLIKWKSKKQDETGDIDALLSQEELQAVIDKANTQTKDGFALAKAIHAVNASLVEGGAEKVLTALKEPVLTIHSINDECASTYQNKLLEVTKEKAQKVGADRDEGWSEYHTKDRHTYYYNSKTDQLQWEKPDKFTRTSYEITHSEIQSVVTKVTSDFYRWVLFKTKEPLITLLQAMWRGILVRRVFKEHLQYLRDNEPYAVKLQAHWKGYKQRQTYYKRLEYLNSLGKQATLIQSLIRMWRQQKQYHEQLAFFAANVKSVIIIQSAWRAHAARKHYKRLKQSVTLPVESTRPSSKKEKLVTDSPAQRGITISRPYITKSSNTIQLLQRKDKIFALSTSIEVSLGHVRKENLTVIVTEVLNELDFVMSFIYRAKSSALLKRDTNRSATLTIYEESLFINLAHLVKWVDTPVQYHSKITTEEIRIRVKDFEKSLEILVHLMDEVYYSDQQSWDSSPINNTLPLNNITKMPSIQEVTENGNEEPPPLPVKKRHFKMAMSLERNVKAPNWELSPEPLNPISHLAEMQVGVPIPPNNPSYQHGPLPLTKEQIQKGGQEVKIIQKYNQQLLECLEEGKPALPPKKKHILAYQGLFNMEYSFPEEIYDSNKLIVMTSETPPPIPIKKKQRNTVEDATPDPPKRTHNACSRGSTDKSLDEDEENLLEVEDVTAYLRFNNKDDGGYSLRGGSVDALISYAASPLNIADKHYTEAFLLIYSTFVTHQELVNKLVHRLEFFYKENRQTMWTSCASLLVRVVKTDK